MSPRRPRLTTSTLVTTMKLRIIHNKKKLFFGSRGSMWMPRKISIIAIKEPSVVLERATHL
jgi:hypothetical protein